MGVEKLHEKDIVHRDLTLDSVTIQEDGYLKFENLSSCKKLEDFCYTMIGTLQYQAPEVFLCTGYDFAADFWSLGILLYELLTGTIPFNESDPIK